MSASPPNSDGDIVVHEDGTKPPNNSSDSLFIENSDGRPAAAVTKDDASKEDVVAKTPAISNNSGDNNHPASNNEGGSPDAAGIPDAQLIGMASQMMQRLGPGAQQLFTQQYEGSKARLSALQAENAALKRRVEEMEKKDEERMEWTTKVTGALVGLSERTRVFIDVFLSYDNAEIREEYRRRLERNGLL